MTSEKHSHDETVEGKVHVDDPVAPIPHYPGDSKDDIKNEYKALEADAGSLDEEELEESIRLVPKIVRELVSMEDDPTLPTVTFR